jgi:hypothetical protein
MITAVTIRITMKLKNEATIKMIKDSDEWSDHVIRECGHPIHIREGAWEGGPSPDKGRGGPE